MRDEEFGFKSRLSTPLHLARLVEVITRNISVKKPTGAVFMDVTKAFDTVWIDGPLYRLTLLIFPSYIFHTISSYLRGRTFETSFQTAKSSPRGLHAVVAQDVMISPVLFSMNVSDMPSASHHLELALYADDTAIIVMPCKPTLLVSYLDSCLNDIRRCLSEWRIAIFSKSNRIIIARVERCFIQPRPVTFFG